LLRPNHGTRGVTDLLVQPAGVLGVLGLYRPQDGTGRATSVPAETVQHADLVHDWPDPWSRIDGVIVGLVHVQHPCEETGDLGVAALRMIEGLGQPVQVVRVERTRREHAGRQAASRQEYPAR